MGCLQSKNTDLSERLTKKPLDADIVVLKAKKQRDLFLAK